MNSKAKLSLTITAMVLVAMIAIVSIIAVFAARTQNFTSSITVSYTSREVQGTATARWGLYNDYIWNNMKDDNGNMEIHFEREPLENAALSPDDIVLENEDDFVVFEYNFTNDGPHPYELTLTYEDDDAPDENVNLYTWATPIKSTADEDVGTLDVDFSCGLDYTKDNYMHDKFTNTLTTTVIPDEKISIYIMLEIADIGEDANFSGTISFDLDGTAATDYTEDLLYYTNGETATIIGVANGTPSQDYEGVTLLNKSELNISPTYNGLPIQTIAAFAFYGQAKLNRILSFGNVNYLGCTAFSNSGLSGELILAGTVKTICFSAFSSCKSLDCVIIQNGVEYIGISAFISCSSIKSVIILGNVIIESYAFSYLENLNEVTIDSREVCDNLLSWDTGLRDELKVGGQIKAKYEVNGLLDYHTNSTHFTKNESQENGYWVYTKVSN